VVEPITTGGKTCGGTTGGGITGGVTFFFTSSSSKNTWSFLQQRFSSGTRTTVTYGAEQHGGGVWTIVVRIGTA
jgi:hypothetical protein